MNFAPTDYCSVCRADVSHLPHCEPHRVYVHGLWTEIAVVGGTAEERAKMLGRIAEAIRDGQRGPIGGVCGGVEWRYEVREGCR